MVCMLPRFLGDSRTVLCSHRGPGCTGTVSMWAVHQGPSAGASIPAGPRKRHGPGPPGKSTRQPTLSQALIRKVKRTRAHLTLALSTPIPKLMVATITGTFSSIHSFCTSVLSEAFRPIKEGKLGKGTHISLGSPLGLPWV